jgi:hypothetical protein
VGVGEVVVKVELQASKRALGGYRYPTNSKKNSPKI